MPKDIAVLSCGRSDFSIYLPLLKKLEDMGEVNLHLIVFGSHTSKYHGYTYKEVESFGFHHIIKLDTTLGDDDPESIGTSIGLTAIKMSALWSNLKPEWVFCLGDRYEMLAAVLSTVSFNIKVVHFHGGEKTLGAHDNSFRHALTSLSKIHFVSCEAHKTRVQEILDKENAQHVFNIGALALANKNDIRLMSNDEFFNKFRVDFTQQFVLMTYHPETVNPRANERNLAAIFEVLDAEKRQIIITLPNNDLANSRVREELINFAQLRDRVFTYGSLGVSGYYTAMSKCSYMIGNSSSGIIEAASFGCYVINVGSRQKGRCCSDNVFHVSGDAKSIKKVVNDIQKLPRYSGRNIYFNPGGVNKVLEVLEI